MTLDERIGTSALFGNTRINHKEKEKSSSLVVVLCCLEKSFFQCDQFFFHLPSSKRCLSQLKRNDGKF